MCASFPVSRAPCPPFLVELSFLYHKLVDRLHWILFGETLLLKELKKLRVEIHLQKQAMIHLCAAIREENETLGRILTAQLSLYLENGTPDRLRNYI